MKTAEIIGSALPGVLIWDVGGVFINYKNLWQDDEFIGNCGCGGAEIERFFTTYPALSYEEGKIDNDEFFRLAKERLGYRFGFGKFAADFCECCRFELNRDVFELFLEVKMKYADATRFWILSNSNDLHYGHLYRRYPGLFANFSEIFLSFKMGSIKPDLAIYEKMLKAGGAGYLDCLFIDDKWENGLVPRQYGMGFVHYKDPEQLRSALAASRIVI